MANDVPTKVEQFFAKYRLRRYSKGQVLLLSDANADYIYHLVDGKVKMYDVSRRGDEIILNIFRPPAFFPMSLAINKELNPYIYEAETAIEFRLAPASDVVEFIRENPDVMYDLLSRVYRGVDGVLGRVAHLMSSGAKGRLMYELLLEARRFGDVQDDGSCILDIHAKELGARAGLTRETVSRETQKLKADGLITMQSRKIRINDLAALERKLGAEV